MVYYQKSYQTKRRNYHKLLWLLIIFALSLSAFSFLISRYTGGDTTNLISPLIKATQIILPVEKLESEVTPPIKGGLANVVQKETANFKGNYSVAVKNLKNNEFYYSNEHTSMQTASLYKLWVMATVYDQIRFGALSEDQTLSENIATLNSKFNIDQESAELTSGSLTLTVKNALIKMITISDNYAALLLTEKVGLAKVNTFLKNNSFTESSVGLTGGPPQATASDMALFFEKLYRGKLNESKYTDSMIELLKAQKKNNKLPKYFDHSVVIAHKTGELGTFSHDAGIVYLPNNDYIIVVMTDSPSPVSTEDLIGRLSKNIYDYYSN